MVQLFAAAADERVGAAAAVRRAQGAEEQLLELVASAVLTSTVCATRRGAWPSSSRTTSTGRGESANASFKRAGASGRCTADIIAWICSLDLDGKFGAYMEWLGRS